MEDLFLSNEFFNSSSIGITIIDSDKTIVNINNSMLNMTGYIKDELIGKNIEILGSKSHNKTTFKDFIDSIEKNDFWEGEIWNRRKNGELFLVKRYVFLNKNEKSQKKFFITFSIDITEDKDIEQKFKNAYYKDAVTGLPNKHMFSEIFERSLKKSERKKRKTSIIFCDLSRFRKINESFGYLAGDELLKEIANRLRNVSGEDSILTRMGGDLFAIMLPETNNESEIVETLEKITNSFRSKPFFVDGQEVFLTICMGVAIYPQDGKTKEELFRNADLAKSRAKESGGESYQFYTPSLNVKVFEKLVMETNLRKAIERNEFTLYYQPKMDIKNNKITSAEALMRWIHPELGIVPPGRFIPLAEETGLIVPMGEWAIKEACKQIKEWEDKGIQPLNIAVNLSSRQFQQENLVDFIKNTIKESKINPIHLEFEITESLMMVNVEESIEKLNALREMGIRISIDDFGTGYSSLGHLVKFPINYLKIDRSFIQHVHQKKSDETITSTIIAMAHELNLEVIAEGVEVKEHLEFLKKENCEYYQGYFLSPPIPSNELESLVDKHNKK